MSLVLGSETPRTEGHEHRSVARSRLTKLEYYPKMASTERTKESMNGSCYISIQRPTAQNLEHSHVSNEHRLLMSRHCACRIAITYLIEQHLDGVPSMLSHLRSAPSSVPSKHQRTCSRMGLLAWREWERMHWDTRRNESIVLANRPATGMKVS